MPFAPLLLAVVLAAAPAKAANPFLFEAATGGAGHWSAQASLVAGEDVDLSLRAIAVGLIGRFDYGVFERLQLGFWGGASLGGEVCVDAVDWGECFMVSQLGGGGQARIGLVRWGAFGLGVDLGASARRIHERRRESVFGLSGDVIANLHLTAATNLFARVGYTAASTHDEANRDQVWRGPFAVAGAEFLDGTVHPFFAVELKRLWTTYTGVPGTPLAGQQVHHELGIAVNAGVTFGG